MLVTVLTPSSDVSAQYPRSGEAAEASAFKRS